MKKIISSFLAIFIIGMISSAFINKANTTKTIIIQSWNKNLTQADLSRSAQIISERIRSFTGGNPDVSVIPGKKQIKVNYSIQTDVKILSRLLTQKGELSFYESCNQREMSEIIDKNNHLFSLLKDGNGDAKIGCVTLKDTVQINEAIRNAALNGPCRFVWSEEENSQVCLYALKLSENQGPLMEWQDVEQIKPVLDKITAYYDLEIKFKKAAAGKWFEASKKNLNRSVLIILDNKVIYSPVLKSEIRDGLCEISGNFTETEARFFSAIVSNGVLPGDFVIIE